MMKLTKALALAGLFLIGVPVAKAQQSNLLLNGNFEEEHVWKAANPRQYVANHWSTSQRIDPSLANAGRSGKALQIIPNRITAEVRAIKTTVVNDELVTDANYIAITPGSGYTLTFWYKVDNGATKYPSLGLRFTWAKANGEELSLPGENGAKLLTRRLDSKEWKQETFEFTAPSNADIRKLGLMLRLTGTDGDPILFDDISLVETRPATPPAPPAPAVPTGLAATSKFQREIELTWAAATATETIWELMVGEGNPIELRQNNYTLDDLEPNTSYNIKLRSKVNGVYSDWTSALSVQTTDYIERPESTARVPHLRTISEEGNCPQTLLLYYNDLANKQATISYTIDGISTPAQGKTITFPKKGKQVLSIEIVESADKVWSLEYNVNVQ